MHMLVYRVKDSVFVGCVCVRACVSSECKFTIVMSLFT